MFYAVYNYWGNSVVGFETVHVFHTAKERDKWVDDDEFVNGNYHCKSVLSSYYSVRELWITTNRRDWVVHEKSGKLFRYERNYNILSITEISETGEEIGKSQTRFI